MKANYLLIQHFNDNGVLRYYAAWLYFKRVFANGCFYKSTNIASVLGLSKNTTQKYIKFFLDNGWASYHCGNFRLCGKGSLKNLYGITLFNDVRLKMFGTITEILNSLRYVILEVKFKQFEYIQRSYRDLVNPKTLKAYKSAKRKNISFSGPQDESDKIALSYISIAKMLLVSKAKAVQLVKQFSKFLTKVSGKLVYVGSFRGIGSEYLGSNQFFYKGRVFSLSANKYQFN